MGFNLNSTLVVPLLPCPGGGASKSGHWIWVPTLEAHNSETNRAIGLKFAQAQFWVFSIFKIHNSQTTRDRDLKFGISLDPKVGFNLNQTLGVPLPPCPGVEPQTQNIGFQL